MLIYIDDLLIVYIIESVYSFHLTFKTKGTTRRTWRCSQHSRFQCHQTRKYIYAIARKLFEAINKQFRYQSPSKQSNRQINFQYFSWWGYLDAKLHSTHRIIVGSLAWLSNRIRPDLVFSQTSLLTGPNIADQTIVSKFVWNSEGRKCPSSAPGL